MKKKAILWRFIISSLLVSQTTTLQGRCPSAHFAQNSSFELRFTAIDREKRMVDNSPTRIFVPSSFGDPFIPLPIPGEAYTGGEYPPLIAAGPLGLTRESQGMSLIVPANLLEGDIVEGNPLNSRGAVFLVRGGAKLFGARISSDESYPLTIKVVQVDPPDASGARLCIARYLCGHGTIKTKTRETVELGKEDTVATWLPQLKSKDPFNREAASQALGWLTHSELEKDKAVPALIDALNDETMEIRRNAAESLGRIGDVRALKPLDILLTKERSEWIKRVGKESVDKIKR
jgi:HEAT repeats